MSERYEQINIVRREFWSDGSPVILSAHSLVKDNISSNVFAQCKFTNISGLTISTLYVCLECIGADGNPVQNVDEYVHLDLSIAPGQSFGDDKIIELPDKATRKFFVMLKKAVFSDGKTWQPTSHANFVELPTPRPLSELGDLMEQYVRLAPPVLQGNLPEQQSTYWRCGCGQVNLNDSIHCVRCCNELESQLAAANPTTLEKQMEQWRRQEAERKETQQIAKKKRRKRIKKFAIMGSSILLVVVAVSFTTNMVVSSLKYSTAQDLFAEGKYDEAIIEFEVLSGYKDASEMAAMIKHEQLSTPMAVAKENGVKIAAGTAHTVGLKDDGRVVATGYNDHGQCDVSGWSDIVAVSVGINHTVGLKSDGTVVATGANDHGQCNVRDWNDIVAVSTGYSHTIGLKADGSVVATEYTGDYDYGQCNVSDWNDIVAVSAKYNHSIGLKADGSVVATGENEYDECDVSDWSDIVAISGGSFQTIGLKSDGTVIAKGENEYGQCDVSGWSNIVAVSGGGFHTIGLKADGTVITAGENYLGECEVSDWSDIVAVSAGIFHTVGLKSDGTVVATGDNDDGQCDVSDWDLWE